MYSLIVHTESMASILKVETWFIISALLAPVGYVVQDVVADAMTVEAVPSADDQGIKYSTQQIKIMHTTMQTLGRFAIIGGFVLVALVNVIMFAGVSDLSEPEKIEIYGRIYLYALVIPIVSVSGVFLAIYLKQRRLEQLRKSKAIVWQGHCSVHTRFSVAQIKKARLAYPDINVIVHPECVMETVQQADSNGSTEFIIDTINRAPTGSKWAVGTEISLVNRIASENPDKTVFCLDSVVCPCSTMYRTHPAYLLWTLEKLVNGEVINQISVDEETAHYARIALDRMLKEV